MRNMSQPHLQKVTPARAIGAWDLAMVTPVDAANELPAPWAPGLLHLGELPGRGQLHAPGQLCLADADCTPGSPGQLGWPWARGGASQGRRQVRVCWVLQWVFFLGFPPFLFCSSGLGGGGWVGQGFGCSSSEGGAWGLNH